MRWFIVLYPWQLATTLRAHPYQPALTPVHYSLILRSLFVHSSFTICDKINKIFIFFIKKPVKLLPYPAQYGLAFYYAGKYPNWQVSRSNIQVLILQPD